MNNTSDASQASDRSFGSQTLGGFGYALGLSIGVIVIFVIVTYASYMCKRVRGDNSTATLNRRPNPRSTPDDSTTNDDSSTTTTSPLSVGLDEATLSSYPKFTYSQLKPHKNNSTTSAGCSICLADYTDTDLLRMLPDCGHIYHLKCIDPWLMLHPSCPLCRNSPLLATPLASPAVSIPIQ